METSDFAKSIQTQITTDSKCQLLPCILERDKLLLRKVKTDVETVVNLTLPFPSDSYLHYGLSEVFHFQFLPASAGVSDI
jgi:hypothetical protein